MKQRAKPLMKEAAAALEAKDAEIASLKAELDRARSDALEEAAKELAHHLSTPEDAALSEVWQERIRALSERKQP